MALNQTFKKQERLAPFVVPEDTHVGILYSVIDLGLHDTGFINEKTGKPVIHNLVSLTFELPGCLMSDMRPAVQTKTVNASLNEQSNLRPILLALGLTEKELNNEKTQLKQHFKNVLGKMALVTVENKVSRKGNKYANIINVTKVPSSMQKEAKKSTNAIKFIEDIEAASAEDIKVLPEFLQTKIKSRLQVRQKGAITEDLNDPNSAEDLPF